MVIFLQVNKEETMEKSFYTSLNIFKYIFIAFCLIYWIGIIIDDWVFIEKYWSSNWVVYVGIWAAWFLIYSLMLSLFYWGSATLIILINHKIIKPLKEK